MADNNEDPGQLQAQSVEPGEALPLFSVRLVVDEITHYDEQYPADVIRGIINPSVADFFVLVKSPMRGGIPRCKAHYLHTSYVRELLLLDEMPAVEQAGSPKKGG